MKSIVILIILSALSFFRLPAQDLMVFGGLNNNRFCDYKRNNTHFNTAYSSLSGNNAGIGIDNVRIGHVPFMFTLRMTNYKGNIYTAKDDNEGGSTTIAEVEKETLGLGIYPLNVKIFSNKVNFSMGAEFNALIHANTKVYQASWQGNPAGSMLKPVENHPDNILNKYTMGLTSRLAYKINIGKNVYIMPQYTFYLGLSDEFRNIETHTKSYRHLFEIGVVKRLPAKGR